MIAWHHVDAGTAAPEHIERRRRRHLRVSTPDRPCPKRAVFLAVCGPQGTSISVIYCVTSDCGDSLDAASAAGSGCFGIELAACMLGDDKRRPPLSVPNLVTNRLRRASPRSGSAIPSLTTRITIIRGTDGMKKICKTRSASANTNKDTLQRTAGSPAWPSPGVILNVCCLTACDDGDPSPP